MSIIYKCDLCDSATNDALTMGLTDYSGPYKSRTFHVCTTCYPKTEEITSDNIGAENLFKKLFEKAGFKR